MLKVAVTFAQDEFLVRDLITTKKLGCGRYEVFHAKGPSACEEYAVKVYPRGDSTKACYNREKDILSALDHPHVIKQFPVMNHNADFDMIVMEYALYGDFFDIVTKGGLAHEVHMRTYFHQLISGLEYIHSQGMAHLDLKLDNLLLGRDFLLKITDFDQAQLWDENREICAGTNSYRAPEVRNRTCTDMYAADIFSLGVILYAFKTKQYPFVEPDNDRYAAIPDYDLFNEDFEAFWEVKSQKMSKTPDFFSEDFRILLKGMCEQDPSKRWTIQDIKSSEWYNKPILSPEGLKFHMGRVCQRIFQK